jgi:hypothetical protein
MAQIDVFLQAQTNRLQSAGTYLLSDDGIPLNSVNQGEIKGVLQPEVSLEVAFDPSKQPKLDLVDGFIVLFDTYVNWYNDTFDQGVHDKLFIDWLEERAPIKTVIVNTYASMDKIFSDYGATSSTWSLFNMYLSIKDAMPYRTTGVGNAGTPKCNFGGINYQFEIVQRVANDLPVETIDGISIGNPHVLEFRLKKCCTNATGFVKLGGKNGTGDIYGTQRIIAEVFSAVKQCSDSSVGGGKGIVTYERYFDVRKVIIALYDALDTRYKDSTMTTEVLLLQELLTYSQQRIYPKGDNVCDLNPSRITQKNFKGKIQEFNTQSTSGLKWGSSVGNGPGYLGIGGVDEYNFIHDIVDQVANQSDIFLVEKFLEDANISATSLKNTKVELPTLLDPILVPAVNSYNTQTTGTLVVKSTLVGASGTVDACSGTIIVVNPSNQGNVTTTAVCNTPYDSNRRLHWSLRKKEVNKPEYFQDIIDYKNNYDISTKLFTNLELQYPVDIKDGSVRIKTGKSFDTNQNINIRKTSLSKIERKQLASNPCYSATAETFIMDIKRRRKLYLELVCGVNSNIPVNYFSPSGINDRIEIPTDENGVINLLTNTTFGDTLVNGVINPGETIRGKFVTSLALKEYGNRIQREDTGEYAGMWYIWEDIYYPLLDQNGNRNFISDIADETTIQFNKNSQNCEPGEYCIDKGWIPDPTDLCGCVEVSVQECYDVYPELVYTDAFGMQKKLSERLILKIYPYDPDYPFLTKGQRVVNARRSTAAACDPSPIKLYHQLLYGGDILPAVSKNEVFGIFNGSGSLLCYNTSSLQPADTKKQYYDIVGCDNCDTSPLYAVTYGHYEGSGSVGYNYDYSDSSTKAIYSQFRLLALDPTDTRFTFYNSGSVGTPKDVYVINYYRNGLTHRLDLGNFEINLAELNGTAYANKYYTGSNVQVSSSNKILTLIDNSGDIDDSQFCTEDPNSYYDIVSGSLLTGTHTSGTGSNITTYGKIYHNLGIIVLDGSKLNSYLNFNSVTGSNMEGNNALKLHTSISGAAVLNKPMQGRRVKTKTTNHYFVRVPVEAANYSTNPTYVLDTADKKGYVKHDCFIENPVTYITTVGLFNDKNEMLAVAKLNKPIQKSYENDILIKIRLNW